MFKRIAISVILLIICCAAAQARNFIPATDGWNFENWGEQSPYCIGSCDLSWDLYRQTYLGINPTHNCVEAPLDCLFYETVFKSCAKNGNCGGMSLLSLALFKYGGYMGFCSPAGFYTGVKSPDRADLHQAMNILQSRQFSASGIENFIDVVDAGNLDNAVAAFNKVKECLASGDYAVLSIANSAIGDMAHTVIPYAILDGPSGGFPKKLFIWDSVIPYDDHSTWYDAAQNFLLINSPTSWKYVRPANPPSDVYSSSGPADAWCFAVPMSMVLHKSRHPLALDMVLDALMTLFVSGPGCAVSQVSDDQGHRLYKTDADVHLRRNEFETDPAKRLKGACMWPWYAAAPKPASRPVNRSADVKSAASAAQAVGDPPGELYFVRRRAGSSSPLNITISGAQYRAVFGGGGNVIRIDATSSEKAKDVIRVSRMGGLVQSMDIKTLGAGRSLNIRQIRQDTGRGEWRSIEVKNLKATRDIPITLDVIGDMEAVVVSSRDQVVSFDVDIQSRLGGRHTTKTIEKLSTTPGRLIRVAPEGSRTLEKSEAQRLELERSRVSGAVRTRPTTVK